VAKICVTLVQDKEMLACKAASTSKTGSILFMISLVSVWRFVDEPEQLLSRREEDLEEGDWVELHESAA
jgi:hypothetical protein